MYVPWMAYTVWQHNLALQDGQQHVSLEGMAVGDPVMSNSYQYPTYAATLHGMGVVMTDERDKLAAIFHNATILQQVHRSAHPLISLSDTMIFCSLHSPSALAAPLTSCALQQAGQCEASFKQWNRVWNDDGGFSCKPHCEFLFRAMTGSSETENLLLGSEPREYGTYNHLFLKAHAEEFHFAGSPTQLDPQLSEGGLIYETMVKSGDICNASAPLYTTLFLEAGIDVVVYSSNVDPLLGPPTTEAGIQHAWDHAERAYPVTGAVAKAAYYSEPKTIWAVSAQDYETSLGPAGYARCTSRKGASGVLRRFCYVIVRNAGHEAMSFQPRASYDMNERILHSRPFNGSDITPNVPKCAPCGGVAPLAGGASPGCHEPPPG
jgi:vitellogenic carboxypeptidase-like protein